MNNLQVKAEQEDAIEEMQSVSEVLQMTSGEAVAWLHREAEKYPYKKVCNTISEMSKQTLGATLADYILKRKDSYLPALAANPNLDELIALKIVSRVRELEQTAYFSHSRRIAAALEALVAKEAGVSPSVVGALMNLHKSAAAHSSYIDALGSVKKGMTEAQYREYCTLLQQDKGNTFWYEAVVHPCAVPRYLEANIAPRYLYELRSAIAEERRKGDGDGEHTINSNQRTLDIFFEKVGGGAVADLFILRAEFESMPTVKVLENPEKYSFTEALEEKHLQSLLKSEERKIRLGALSLLQK